MNVTQLAAKLRSGTSRDAAHRDPSNRNVDIDPALYEHGDDASVHASPLGVGETTLDPSVAAREHNDWTPKYGKVQKCDFCDRRSTGVLHRCEKCAIHICHDCSVSGKWEKNKLHFIDPGALDWERHDLGKPGKDIQVKKPSLPVRKQDAPGHMPVIETDNLAPTSIANKHRRRRLDNDVVETSSGHNRAVPFPLRQSRSSGRRVGPYTLNGSATSSTRRSMTPLEPTYVTNPERQPSAPAEFDVVSRIHPGFPGHYAPIQVDLAHIPATPTTFPGYNTPRAQRQPLAFSAQPPIPITSLGSPILPPLRNVASAALESADAATSRHSFVSGQRQEEYQGYRLFSCPEMEQKVKSLYEQLFGPPQIPSVLNVGAIPRKCEQQERQPKNHAMLPTPTPFPAVLGTPIERSGPWASSRPFSPQGEKSSGYAQPVQAWPQTNLPNEPQLSDSWITNSDTWIAKTDQKLLEFLREAWNSHPTLVHLRSTMGHSAALEILWGAFEIRRTRITMYNFCETIRWFVNENNEPA